MVLPISRNRQRYWPVREIGRHSAHFTNWAIRLPISWNGQFHRLGVTYASLWFSFDLSSHFYSLNSKIIVLLELETNNKVWRRDRNHIHIARGKIWKLSSRLWVKYSLIYVVKCEKMASQMVIPASNDTLFIRGFSSRHHIDEIRYMMTMMMMTFVCSHMCMIAVEQCSVRQAASQSLWRLSRDCGRNFPRDDMN